MSQSKKLPPFLARAIRIRALELPPLEKLILHTLNARADKSGVCFPSTSTIELDTGLSRTSVFAHLKSLRRRGLIICTRFGERNHRNIYTLNLFNQDSLTPVVPNTEPHEYGKRTRRSSGDEHTSSGDEPVNVRDTYLSSIRRDHIQEIIQEHSLNFDGEDEKLLESWIEVLENVAMIVPSQIFASWFNSLIPLSESDGFIYVCCPDEFTHSYLLRSHTSVLDHFKIKLKVLQYVSH